MKKDLEKVGSGLEQRPAIREEVPSSRSRSRSRPGGVRVPVRVRARGRVLVRVRVRNADMVETSTERTMRLAA